jgi:MinD-like ATPase involved in chromosome partitioning or flagellar assembly
MEDTRQVTLAAPRGTLTVRVPLDIPIGELMPDFIAAGLPDGDHHGADGEWLLGPAGGDPYPPTMTLGDCDLDSESVLVLHRLNSRAPSPTEEPIVPPVATAVEDRPLSARNTRVLPVRLTAVQRLDRALLAVLERNTSPVPTVATTPTGAAPPGAFTLAARRSPARRVREAWARSDYVRQLDECVLAPRLRRCTTVAVVSPKGGVGKTHITAILGSLLAFLRRDRVIAVDANPDFGSLGRRLVPDHPVFIDDLLAGPLEDGALSVTHLDAQLGRGPNGLMVAPAPTDPARAAQLDEPAYRTLFTRLSDLAGTLVLDCGTGLDAPPARAALGCADQLVLVTDAEPDTASLVWEAAQRLEDGPPLVLVANKLDRSSRLDVVALERTIPFARGLVEVPHDRAGADQLLAGRFSWSHAPDRWRVPLRELAALLAADWPRLDLAP